MPIPIIIAILIALFTLGATMKKQAGSPDQVVIIGGKNYNWINKKNNHNTLVVMAPEQKNHTIIIKGQRESASFDHIFQALGMYQIEGEPITARNNSINSNIKQAVALSVKE
jgi:plastocyanin